MSKWTKEQQEAIDCEGTNIIVSAGAGSGKTAVLTERVIRKLKSGININQILVLTFTNAAAFEMKERIRKAILSTPILKEQLDLIDGAYITTFDSFSLSIVKKYHYLLNIPKNVSIIDSSIIYDKKVKILDAIMEKYYREEDSDFLKLIADFCIKEDRDIKKYILEINNKMDLLMDKSKYLDSYIDRYFSPSFIDAMVEEYMNRINLKFSLVRERAKDLLAISENDFYDKLSAIINKYDGCNSYEDIFDALYLKLPSLPRNSTDELKTHKENWTRAITDLKNYMELPTLKEVREKQLMTLPYNRIIVKIIRELDNNIMKFKRDNNVYEFNDIAKMAISIVSENDDVRNYLKNYFNEIMIDEYQDTSNIQEAFINLIANDNVYMVGDIKQSIYRFRNADPYIFKSKYDAYAQNNGGVKIDLLKNFRSRDEVLNNINLIFDAIMDDEIGGARYQESHRMIFGNATYINEGNTDQEYDMEILDYDYDKSIGYTKDEIEIFAIVKDIREKIASNYQVFDKDKKILRSITYNDFCILLDRSTKFDLYKKIFEYFNIPLTKYTSTNIKNDDDIILIKNILTLLLSVDSNKRDIDFKYNFMSIGRSYLFRYSDEQLFDYIECDEYADSELYKTILKISNKSKYLSLSKIIEEIIEEFSFYDRSITVGDVEKTSIRLEYIINLANSMEEMGFGILEFRDYLECIIESDEKMECEISDNIDNSVKIMTIHKSKGLEYHVCYFAEFMNEFNLRDLQKRFSFKEEYGIITPYFEDGIGDTFYHAMYRDDFLKEEISEKIRLLYVALTRCKEKMILVCDLNDEFEEVNSVVDINRRSCYRSFKNILDSIVSIINPFIKKIDINTLNLTRDYQLIKKTNYSKSIEKSFDKIKNIKIDIPNHEVLNEHFSKTSVEVINRDIKEREELGTYMHYLFEVFDFKKPDFSKIPKKYHKYLEQFLNSGIDFSGTIYKEYEFISDEDDRVNHGIIDLMIEYPDHIDIIDYKLKNIEDSAYQNQLNGYRNYINEKMKKEVFIYLYSIIDGKLQKI